MKELSNPRNGTDQAHLDGYYAFHLMEKIDLEDGTIFTDKAIFVYGILCELSFADNQDLLLLDAEPTNGVMRKSLSEYVRTKIKSYQAAQHRLYPCCPVYRILTKLVTSSIPKAANIVRRYTAIRELPQIIRAEVSLS